MHIYIVESAQKVAWVRNLRQLLITHQRLDLEQGPFCVVYFPHFGLNSTHRHLSSFVLAWIHSFFHNIRPWWKQRVLRRSNSIYADEFGIVCLQCTYHFSGLNHSSSFLLSGTRSRFTISE